MAHPIPAREESDKALENLLFDYGNICVKADGGDEAAKTQEGIKIDEIKALIHTNRATLLSQLEAAVEKLPTLTLPEFGLEKPTIGKETLLALIRSYKGK